MQLLSQVQIDGERKSSQVGKNYKNWISPKLIIIQGPCISLPDFYFPKLISKNDSIGSGGYFLKIKKHHTVCCKSGWLKRSSTTQLSAATPRIYIPRTTYFSHKTFFFLISFLTEVDRPAPKPSLGLRGDSATSPDDSQVSRGCIMTSLCLPTRFHLLVKI